MTKTMIAALMAGALVTGCQNTNFGAGQAAGTLGGAAAGGLIGSQFGSGSGQLAATALGVALGAFAGNYFGQQFDNNDQYAVGNAGQTALNSGQTQTWQSPNNPSLNGQIQPVGGTYQINGRNCQNFRQTVFLNGRAETAQGVACQNFDGTWEVLN